VNSKQFARYLERDQGCVHCGTYVAAVPHHRQNRGMGGSKKRDNPANILVLCAEVNGLLESDATWAVRARHMGGSCGRGMMRCLCRCLIRGR
jgi:hypothetical protein